MPGPTPGESHRAVSQEETPFPPQLLEETLKTFIKAVRAHQLYMHNNPTYLRAIETARNAFAPLWKETDKIVLTVSDTDLRWHGHPVLSEPEKASDSLPWILYKDGLRELEMRKGFESEELIGLLDILQRVRRASPDEDDLLTMMWEQDFVHLRYKYIELSEEMFSYLDSEQDAPKQVDVAEVLAQPVQSGDAPAIVSMSDFNSTLYFLDSGEIEYLHQEVAKEYHSDLRTNIGAVLLDVFELQGDTLVREEVVSLLESYMVHLLSINSFSGVAYLLRESTQALQRARGITAGQKERLQSLPARLSEKDALSQLLASLEDARELPPQADLEELFAQLRGPALMIVLGWIARTQNAKLKPLLETAAQRLASANTAELVKLIESEDRHVRIEAVRRAGALKTPAAVAPIAKLLASDDADLRHAAVTALSEIASPGAMQALERAIADDDRDVRVSAVRAFAARQYRTALPRIEAALKEKRLRDADLSEKMAFFEAFGTLSGEPGVVYLDSVLNGRGLFGRREDAELRACAAMALGRIGTDRALAVLQKASGDKDVIVRTTINKALRGGAT